MILQFKNCYMLPSFGNPPSLSLSPFSIYIPSPPSAVSLTRFLITNSKSL